VDVARYGNDSSIILPRKGNRIDPWDEYQELNPIRLAMFAKEEFLSLSADRLGVDEIGVGGPVLDWLQMNGLQRQAVGVNVAVKSSDQSRFYQLRDELWWKVREKCMNSQYSFPVGELGDRLCDELSSVRFEESETSRGVIKVESKRQMKIRNVASPNIADALCISEYFFTPYAGAVHNLTKKVSPPKHRRPQRVSSYERFGRSSWMVV